MGSQRWTLPERARHQASVGEPPQAMLREHGQMQARGSQERALSAYVAVVWTGPPSRRMAMPSTGSPRGTPEPKATRHGALRDLLRGLRAGDLATLLLTVAMAADENRMPSADPDEEKRILAFLTRLAEHDAALPPPDCA
jgi:hypothetical protein